ncbi:helix-turn-helix domain-containing protein [Methyloceanibacter caenitepidi]|nr:helix-turn-helix domain-containing protein [Methyloceanibacter caenitepidi]
MSALGSERHRDMREGIEPRNGVRGTLRQIIDPAVALVFEVDPSELGAATRRSPRAAFARQVAMYLTHVVCGLSMTEVGALFARDRTTVAHACEVVEDRRDDPDLDSRVERLECAVAAVIGALSWRGRCK